MGEKRTTARAFHDADEVEDWRVLFSGAHAHYRVGSFAEAARFVAEIAEVAEAVGHVPDVDVRPEGVTVRTASGEYGALRRRDVDLARGISAGPPADRRRARRPWPVTYARGASYPRIVTRYGSRTSLVRARLRTNRPSDGADGWLAAGYHAHGA